MPYTPKLPRYKPEVFTAATPTNIDMRSFVPKILNQGIEGSCVGNAFAGLLNLVSGRVGDETLWSALGIYHDTLVFEGRVGQQGSSPYDSAYVMEKTGAGLEKYWPYDLKNLNLDPPQEYRDSAELSTGHHEIFLDKDNTQDAIKMAISALSEGRPILISFDVREWFYSLGAGKDIKTQQNDMFRSGDYTNGQKIVGSHEVLIVGYDKSINGGSFIFQNSWGGSWGEAGFAAMSAAWITDWTSAIVIDGFAGHDYVYSNNELEIISLYVAEIGRAAESGGLNYWVNELNTKTLDEVSQTIYTISSPNHASETNAQVIEKFYQNVLGRTADQSGLDYWVGKLFLGQTRGSVVVEIIDAVLGYNGIDFQALQSQLLFKNKMAISAYNSVMLDNNDLPSAYEAFSYITHDPQSVEIAKVGIHNMIGLI